jgi:iron complex outermembrane receptor protein
MVIKSLLLILFISAHIFSEASCEFADTTYEVIVIDRLIHGKDQAVSPVVISGKTVRESSKSSAIEVISQESASININARGVGVHGVASGASGAISIRGIGGSPNSQVLLVEDGVPDYQGIFGHPIPDALVPGLIDHIYVVKGGDAVLFGTNALGGVIVAESRWPNSSGMQIESDITYGAYNTLRSRFTILNNIQGYGAAASFTSFSTDGHRDGAGGKFACLQTGIQKVVDERWTLSVQAKGLRMEGADPGPVFAPTPKNWFSVDRGRIQSSAEGLVWNGKMQLSTWINGGIHRLHNGFLSHDFTGGFIAEWDGRISRYISLICGSSTDIVDGTVEDRKEETKTEIPKQFSTAIYSHITYKPVTPLILISGFRILAHEKYGLVPLYKVSFRLTQNEYMAFFGRITRNFRQPTLRELYLPYPSANPALRPEYAVNGEIGTEYIRGRFSIKASGFKTWAHDLIRYFGVWPSAEVVNIDEMIIYGGELETRIKDVGPLTFGGGISLFERGKFTKQSPNKKANSSIEFACLINSCKLKAKLDAEWIGGLYMNNYFLDPMEDVFYVDGTIRLEPLSDKGLNIIPHLTVRNILNNSYETIRYYTMPGIHTEIGISMRF